MLCRADLANLVNEAALLAGRQNKTVVEKIDFIHAVERAIAVTFLSFVCAHLFNLDKCTWKHAYECSCGF